MLTYWIGKAWYKAFGWKLEGDPKRVKKAVLIAAPHTSNWDLPFMLGAGWIWGLRVNWLGKHTLFEPPVFGPFMTWLGGIPVDRRAAHGVVQQAVDVLNATDELLLAVPPEGTRKAVEFWKSGFYHIAFQAKVPIICGYLDFERKVAALGPAIMPSGDIKADMDRIRAVYRDVRAKFPEQESVPRLREEAVEVRMSA